MLPLNSTKNQIDDAINKLAHLAATRNHWVHGDWCLEDETGTILIFDHRAELESPKRSKPVKATDVKNHVEAVLLRAQTLYNLIEFDDLEI